MVTGQHKASDIKALLDSLEGAFGSWPEFTAGSVWIVGAGSRHPHQVTLEALYALTCADIIVHDTLMPRDLLRVAQKNATVLNLGKRAGNHSATQTEICRTLVKAALKNKKVVRLKGGDPCIFSRLSDEIVSLNDAGIPYRILPGLASAQTAAACLGIPLTHRDLSHALFFCSGYQGVKNSLPPLDWRTIHGSNATLVLFMAADALQTIAPQLIDSGRNPSQPVAAMSCMGMPTESLSFATLGTVHTLAKIERPAIYIVGDVVSMSPHHPQNRPEHVDNHALFAGANMPASDDFPLHGQRTGSLSLQDSSKLPDVTDQ